MNTIAYVYVCVLCLIRRENDKQLNQNKFEGKGELLIKNRVLPRSVTLD